MPGDQVPVEGKTIATRQCVGAARRLRVEQQEIGTIFVSRGGRQVVCPGNRDRFHDRTAETRFDRSDPLRALASVKLEDIERCGVKGRLYRSVVGIDE